MNKQIKSLLWRMGAMLAIAAINIVVENLSGFGLTASYVTVIGLIAGEFTKVINRKYLIEERIGATFRSSR